MRTDGIETLIAVVRRSRLIVLVLVVLGALTMFVVRHSEGPQYQATASVILSPMDLASAFSGFNGYVDPQLVDDTEGTLAQAPQLFARAAASTQRRLGSGTAIGKSVSSAKNGTTVTFSASDRDPKRAVAMANAVARVYPSWRASVSGATIGQAISELQKQLRLRSKPDPNVVSQLSKLRVLKTLTSGNVLLVEPAQDAVKTRPKPTRDALLGAFIGFFVSLLAVGIREALDTKVRTEAEVESLLDIPVLGAVETLPRRTSLVWFGRDNERYRDAYALLAAGLAQGQENGKGKGKGLVIAVTSATAGEGKTTTASNLAFALAQRNTHTVLLDMDSRKPQIAQMFQLPLETPGVERLIWKEADAASLLWDVSLNGSTVRAHPAVNGSDPTTSGAEKPGSLQVIPMGPRSPANFAAHVERLRPTVEELAKKADYVVIDTPPALAIPDITELAKLVDVVLIVVRHGRVSRRNLVALSRLHRTWPAVKLNAVLVGTRTHGDSYTYYGPA